MYRLSNLFKRQSSPPSVPAGERVYAIGDIHGRLDLFSELLQLIDADDSSRPEARTRILVLGDFIDRGPDSARLLSGLQWWQQRSTGVSALLGNHEATLLAALMGDEYAQRGWLGFGGLATLSSFGVDPPEEGESPESFAQRLTAAVSQPTIEWLRSLPVSIQLGDYFFCHAGVRPGIPLNRQHKEDLLWIRSDFLNDPRDHGAVIVHGHSRVGARVEFAGNRIAIDTGAYETGILSAVGLEGHRQWCISTADPQRPPVVKVST